MRLQANQQPWVASVIDAGCRPGLVPAVLFSLLAQRCYSLPRIPAGYIIHSIITVRPGHDFGGAIRAHRKALALTND